MRSPRPDSYDWYDDALEAPPEIDAAVAGLPESWWDYDWWMAGIAYSALWLLESWTSGGAAAGARSLVNMAYGALTLSLVLVCCYALFKICKPLSERLGQVVCVAAAIALLLAHSFSASI
ncbi:MULTISPECIES: hypothetical protein [Microvirga]|uniref:hypothetical protein n=1 Tax=Microvirga TaxID=186650 RepID=UPI001D001742|nr:hypothetical protein [Microvirga lenta]MCB5177181.1 hypothetical protein [Microvirga lenta]